MMNETKTETEQFFKAKETIRQIFKIENMYVNQWLNEENKRVFCVVLRNKQNEPLTFVLLHTMDYDPINYHTKPLLLDFVYTFTNHRRRGYAMKLKNKIKKKNQITEFCNCDESVELFKKCGFSSTYKSIVRFPISMNDYKLDKICIDDVFDKLCIDDVCRDDIVNNLLETSYDMNGLLSNISKMCDV